MLTRALTQIAIDSQLDAPLRVVARPRDSTRLLDERNRSTKKVILTGATGFVGAHILQELLRTTDANVVCFLRAPSRSVALDRIHHALQQYELWEPRFDGRIHALPADIALPCCGLGPDSYRALRGIEKLYHCAANVSVLHDYLALRETNVVGTKEVLKLAFDINIGRVVYVSSLSIFNALHYEHDHGVPEDLPLARIPLPAGGYAQTKWVAEHLMHQAGNRGIDLTICRPGAVTGHSKTGVCNHKDRFTLFLRACIAVRAAPEIDGIIRITPVDCVSRAIITLSGTPNAHPVTRYHLVNSEYITWNRIAALLVKHGLMEQTVSYDDWLKLLRSSRCVSPGVLSGTVALFTKIRPFHNCPACQINRFRSFRAENFTQATAKLSKSDWAIDSEALVLRYASRLRGVQERPTFGSKSR